MSGRRVVVTDYTFPALAREQAAAEAAGARFEAHRCRSAAEVAAAIRGADVAVVQFAPCPAEAVAGLAPGATLLRYGIGYDNIDVAAARARGVHVGYVPDYCIAEVADHSVAMLLTLLRRIVPMDRSVRQGRWDAVGVARPLRPLADTVVGFLGLGRIGREVLARLRPFGCRFLVADPALDAPAAAALDVEACGAGALFAGADALLLHAPAVAGTVGIVNRATLATMRPHAVIVNTARGRLVDEAALAAALAEGRIGGAALDVFESEPLPAGSPLREAPNLILTPHAAWYSDAAIDRLQGLVAADIARALEGGAPRCPVPAN